MTSHRLKSATNEFFKLHWNLSEPSPRWCKRPFEGIGYLECGNLPGCYALVKDNNIVYIGSAISRGKKQYVGYGLHSRILSYIKRDRSIKRTDEQPAWTFRHGHTAIYTIGFSRERSYLAIALEHFLIGKLPELENRIRVLSKPT
jgi:hypothetical protein